MQKVTEFEIVDEYIKRSDVELIKAIWTSVCEYSTVKILFRYEICMFWMNGMIFLNQFNSKSLMCIKCLITFSIDYILKYK